MYFQSIDDKSECIGVYADGQLHFDSFPSDLTHTWRYTGAVTDTETQYAWLYANGAPLAQCCPEEHAEELAATERKLRAYMKTFKVAKVNLNDHCIFDLVPHDFLKRFCEVKTRITEHVFETHEKPDNYQHLCDVEKLLYKIRYNKLNLSAEGCRHLMLSTVERNKAQELVKNYPYIDYNLFGTVTGRLTTRPGSFPVLTVKKEFRKLLRPHNDLFVALDYNGAEVRMFVELAGEEQPDYDIHDWNVRNVFANTLTRDEAKIEFFGWLYNSLEHQDLGEIYDKKKILDKWYDGEYIITPYQRKIAVDDFRALNYLIQSSTADRVLAKAVIIDKMLEERKSFVSHILHDEIVIDFDNEDRDIIMQIKQTFEDGFLSSMKAGKNYFELKELNL
jgi:hypothetical protein